MSTYRKSLDFFMQRSYGSSSYPYGRVIINSVTKLQFPALGYSRFPTWELAFLPWKLWFPRLRSRSF